MSTKVLPLFCKVLNYLVFVLCSLTYIIVSFCGPTDQSFPRAMAELANNLPVLRFGRLIRLFLYLGQLLLAEGHCSAGDEDTLRTRVLDLRDLNKMLKDQIRNIYILRNSPSYKTEYCFIGRGFV